MSRTVVYVTGTRADYGLMRRTLQAISARPDMTLSLVVTGMHLDPAFGLTVREIERDGFAIADRVSIAAGDGGGSMARGIATMIAGFVDAFERAKPDIVLLLGDRGEMLAGAIAAAHLNIAVAHIHGGERSGTIDEPVRHAISKLAHLHLAATEESANRLVRMGEAETRVSIVGAPGLVGLASEPDRSRAELAAEVGFDLAKPTALMVYHPVHSEAGSAGDGTTAVLDALEAEQLQVVALMPNSDSGAAGIRAVLTDRAKGVSWLSLHTHLERRRFTAWMAEADVMVGNSSSGIIEAATFGTPVVNIGQRQQLRERNANVVDVPVAKAEIQAAVQAALANGRFAPANVYGDGGSDSRIADLLATVPLGQSLLAKCNAY